MRQGDDYLADVVPCIACGERWCRIHWKHWADCSCPGPHVPDLAELDLESDITCQEDSDEIEEGTEEGVRSGDLAEAARADEPGVAPP